MKWNRTVWSALAIGCVALLTACGGGGSDGEADDAVVADYPLRAAYAGYLATPVPEVFNVTVVVENTSCLGRANLTRGMTSNGAFQGTPSVNLSETFWVSLQSCGGISVTPAETFELSQTLYRDAAGAILGTSDASTTSMARTPIALPERIRLGDSATLGTLDIYVGTTAVGTTVVSYAIKPDTDSSVLVDLTYVTTGLAREPVQQDIITYRLGTDGPLRLKRHEITAPDVTLLLASPS